MAKKKKSLPSVTFDTLCVCGARMNVTVTFGRPVTFRVNSKPHPCPNWPAACRLVKAEAAIRDLYSTLGIVRGSLDDASGVVDAGEGEEYAYQVELELAEAVLERHKAYNGDLPGPVAPAPPRVPNEPECSCGIPRSKWELSVHNASCNRPDGDDDQAPLPDECNEECAVHAKDCDGYCDHLREGERHVNACEGRIGLDGGKQVG